MAKILLANGCSHVGGSESDMSFVEYLADKLGMEPVNLAEPGGSNDRIVRTTMEYCAEHKDDIGYVIVGWTTAERFEHIWKRQVNLYGMHRISGHDEQLQKLYDYMMLYCYDDGTTTFFARKRVSQILSLQYFLKAQGLDYLFFDAWSKTTSIDQVPTYPLIDKDKYYKLEEKYSLFQEYHKRMPEYYSEWFHGNETVHTLIGMELYEHIRQRL